MSTPLDTYSAAATRATQVSRAGQLGRVVSAEWIKARSVPSTWTALGSFTFIMVSIGAAITGTRNATDLTGAELTALEPVAEALSGVFMGQVALGILGALIITTEYSSRSVTTTAAAVPQREQLLAGKALLLLGLCLPFALLATTAGAALGLSLLQGKGLGVELTAPGVPGAVLGTTAYLTLIAVLGLAVGSLLRSTAGAVVVLTGLLFLVPVLVGLLPADFADAVLPWLPSQAGQAVLQLRDRPGYLDPLVGLLVLAGYTAVALAAAAVVMRRRDV